MDDDYKATLVRAIRHFWTSVSYTHLDVYKRQVMARTLVKGGAVITQDQADECLIELCRGWKNPQKGITYLVKKMGADLEAVATNVRDGATPLLIAIRRGDDDLAMLLLDRGAEPDFRLGTTRSPYKWVKQN